MQLQLTSILTNLNGMATLAGVAHIHPVVLLAVAIVKNIQQLRENKRAFRWLAEDIYNMVEVVAGVVRDRQSLSDELSHHVDEFTVTLQSTKEFVDAHRSRSSFRRFFTVADDAGKIEDCRRQISWALARFQTQMQMGMFERIAILREAGERDASSHLPAYTAVDAEPVIPEHITRIAEENFDRLLPILGVFTVFQEPPSTRQIAHVLDLGENEVQDVWEPISSYLAGLGADAQVRCLKFLEKVLCQRDGTSSIDAANYHNLVAQWCLEPKVASGDIFYASDCWVHHVCHASPSLQLRDALTDSELPLDPDYLNDLPEIISWLEQIHTDEEEWANLLSIYRERCSSVSD
ncbi:hypothetical protein C8R44DRAFT_984544 [Mycena epipterygia]|nr:hypothetical protein C8R44DRAFT_984544 [Mycena epipterygia]